MDKNAGSSSGFVLNIPALDLLLCWIGHSFRIKNLPPSQEPFFFFSIALFERRVNWKAEIRDVACNDHYIHGSFFALCNETFIIPFELETFLCC